MRDYSQHMFWTLKQDAENWRSLFYGATADKRLTPSIGEPNDLGDPDSVGIGGVVRRAADFGRPAA